MFTCIHTHNYHPQICLQKFNSPNLLDGLFSLKNLCYSSGSALLLSNCFSLLTGCQAYEDGRTASGSREGQKQVTALPLTMFDSDLTMPQFPFLKHGFHYDNYHIDVSVLTFSCTKKGESKGTLLSPLPLTHWILTTT